MLSILEYIKYRHIYTGIPYFASNAPFCSRHKLWRIKGTLHGKVFCTYSHISTKCDTFGVCDCLCLVEFFWFISRLVFLANLFPKIIRKNTKENPNHKPQDNSMRKTKPTNKQTRRNTSPHQGNRDEIMCSGRETSCTGKK